MDLLREKMKCRAGLGARLMGGGGGGESKSDSSTKSTNTDQRVAVQDGIGLSGSSGNTLTYNSSDAVKAIAQMGADTIAKTGEAVVQLNRDASAANVTAWDTTVKASANLVDKLIDRSTGIAQAAITNYQPTQNKAEDSTQKIALYAAAGVAAAVLIARISSK